MSSWKNTHSGQDAYSREDAYSGQDASSRQDTPNGWSAALQAVDVMEYDLGGIEGVAVQLIRYYLSCLTEDAARKLMRKVIKLPEDLDEREQPYAVRELPEQSVVIEGKQLAALIDLAVGEFMDIIEERMLTIRSEETLQLLSVMSGDHRFEDVYNENKEGGPHNMCNVLDRVEQRGRAGHSERENAGKKRNCA